MEKEVLKPVLGHEFHGKIKIGACILRHGDGRILEIISRDYFEADVLAQDNGDEEGQVFRLIESQKVHKAFRLRKRSFNY